MTYIRVVDILAEPWEIINCLRMYFALAESKLGLENICKEVEYIYSAKNG